jgi:hypothetical protein
MPVNRRLFIFGAAAAIATAKAALASGPAAVVHEAIVSIANPRWLHGIEVRAVAAKSQAIIELRRVLTGDPIIKLCLPRLATYVRWSTVERINHIAEMPGQLLAISIDGGDTDAWDIDMLYDEDGNGVVERHFFPALRGPMERIVMAKEDS